MIGRAAIGNPNIFAKLSHNRKKVNFKNYLKLLKKYKQPWKQIKYQAMAFTKGEAGAKRMRRELIGAKTVEDVKRVYG
jgi:tRNA-dihydrouridine synthase